MASRLAVTRISLFFSLLAMFGCGQSPTVPVSGQVVWEDGKPATDLVGCNLEATLQGSKTTARGDVDAEGRFKLSTFANGDGAEPGTLEVAIFPPDRKDPDAPPPKALFPNRYQNAKTSGLTITVERGKNNVVTINLKKS